VNFDSGISCVLKVIRAHDFDPAFDCEHNGPVCGFVHPAAPLPVDLAVLLFDVLVHWACELVGGIIVSADAARGPHCFARPDGFLTRALPHVRVILLLDGSLRLHVGQFTLEVELHRHHSTLYIQHHLFYV